MTQIQFLDKSNLVKLPSLITENFDGSLLIIGEDISSSFQDIIQNQKVDSELTQENFSETNNSLEKATVSYSSDIDEPSPLLINNMPLNIMPIMVSIQDDVTLKIHEEMMSTSKDSAIKIKHVDQNNEDHMTNLKPFIMHNMQKSLSALSIDEEKLITDFISKGDLESDKKSVPLFTEVKVKQWHPQGGGHLFITPILPLKNMIMESSFGSQDKVKESLDKIENLLGDSKSITTLKNEETNITSEQEQAVVFNLQSSQKLILEEKQNVHFQTSFLNSASSSLELINNLKEHLQKFQKNSDHKLTIQMRDSGRDLTIVFQMNEKKGIHVTFRTKDKDWKILLQSNKQKIKESLDESHSNVDIRYIGE